MQQGERSVVGVLGQQRADLLDELEDAVSAPGAPVRLCGAEQSLAARAVGGRQERRALVGRRRGGVCAAVARLACGGLEVGGDGVVGALRGRSAMPRAARLIARGAEHLGEREVRSAALAGDRAAVDRGPHERVTDGDPRAVDDDEPRLLELVERVEIDPELGAGVADGVQLLRVVGGDDQQQCLGGVRQPARLADERALDALADRQRLAQRGASRELGRRERGGQLEQRERVAAGDLQEARADVGVDPLRQQLRRGGGLEAPDAQLGQRRERQAARVAVAGGEQQHDPLRVEPPCDRQQHVGGGSVEPLRVVDHAEHAAAVGDVGQQGQRRQRDEERVVDRAVREAERAPHRRRLRTGKAVQPVEDRAQQLVQAREREVGLRLQTHRLEHGHVAGCRDGMAQQRGLADPRLAAQHEHLAAAGAGAVQQRLDPTALRAPAAQRLQRDAHRHPGSLRDPLGRSKLRTGRYAARMSRAHEAWTSRTTGSSDGSTRP